MWWGYRKSLSNAFLTWLTPFIRQRSTKTNLQNDQESSSSNDISIEYGNGCNSDDGNDGEDDDDINESETEESMSAASRRSRNKKKGENEGKRSNGFNGSKVNRFKHTKLSTEEVSIMKNVSKLLIERLEKKGISG